MFPKMKYQSRRFREAAVEGDEGGVATAEPPKEEPKVEPKAAEPKAEPKLEPKAAEPKSEPKSSDGMTDRERELLHESMKRKEKIQALESQLARFEGIDPEEVRKVLDEQKRREREELEAKGQWEKVKAQMNEEFESERGKFTSALSEKDQTISSLQAQIDELTVGAAFSNSSFIREKLTLPPAKARALYGAYFERGKSGELVAYDAPRGQENRAPLVDVHGNPLPFDTAFEKILSRDPDKDMLFRATLKPGAGSGTRDGDPEPPKKNLQGRDRILEGIAQGALKPADLDIGQ